MFHLLLLFSFHIRPVSYMSDDFQLLRVRCRLLELATETKYTVFSVPIVG